MHTRVPINYTENPHFSITAALCQKLSDMPEKDDKAMSATNSCHFLNQSTLTSLSRTKRKGEVEVEQDREGSVMPWLGSSFKAGDRSPNSQGDAEPHYPRKFLKGVAVGTRPDVTLVRANEWRLPAPRGGGSAPPACTVVNIPLALTEDWRTVGCVQGVTRLSILTLWKVQMTLLL